MFEAEEIIAYVHENSVPLFMCDQEIPLRAKFDDKGFFFSDQAADIYATIKHSPHLYVAFTENPNGNVYVGKSFQNGGRWKRSHAYHLGTLAYHLLDTIRYDDQNHLHWIENWTIFDTVNIAELPYSVLLQKPVRVAFIPFEAYSRHPINALSRAEIKRINKAAEIELIDIFNNAEFNLLNVQNN